MSFLKSFLIGIVLFGLVFTAMTTMFNDMDTNYNATKSENFSQSYNQINESLSVSQEIVQDVYNSTSQEENTFFQKTAGSLAAITTSVGSSFKISNKIIQDFATFLGVSKWLVNGVLAIIMIALTFAIIKLVFSRA